MKKKAYQQMEVKKKNSQYEFAAVVLDCKILTQDEAFRVVNYLNAVPDTQVVFPRG